MSSTDLFAWMAPSAPVDRALWANPYPLFHRARNEDPVHYSPSFDAWFLSRYEDVISAARDSRLSSRRASFKFEGLPPAEREAAKPFERSMHRWMMFSDAPEHPRLRSLFAKAFSPRIVEGMRPVIRRVVDELIDRRAADGRMDLMRDLASPLPSIVVAELLGVRSEDRSAFERWSDDIALFAGAGHATLERSRRAIESWRAMNACIREIVGRRRARPEDDFLSAMLVPDDRGDVLSEDELLAMCVHLLAAGHGATQDMVCNSALLLMQNPELMRAIKENPETIPGALEEFLRYESPLQVLTRVVRTDMTIGGRTIREGQRVIMMLGAANRDPEAFPAPDTLDIRRQDNRHLAYGFGFHYCIGAPLARVEGQVVLEAFAQRLSDMALASRDIAWKTTMSFRGVESLPITFSGRTSR